MEGDRCSLECLFLGRLRNIASLSFFLFLEKNNNKITISLLNPKPTIHSSPITLKKKKKKSKEKEKVEMQVGKLGYNTLIFYSPSISSSLLNSKRQPRPKCFFNKGILNIFVLPFLVCLPFNTPSILRRSSRTAN